MRSHVEAYSSAGVASVALEVEVGMTELKQSAISCFHVKQKFMDF